MTQLFLPLPLFDAPLLEVTGLTIGYENEMVAGDIHFVLTSGQKMALFGGNGSGKTTFLRTIAGLIPPQKGSIRILGLPQDRASRYLGWLGQFHPDNPLLPLRVRDLVRTAHFPERGLLQRLTKEDEALVDEALEFVGMQSCSKRSLGELSGGQRQKVFFAYVLARRAPLILLDEPLQNLDENGNVLMTEACRLWQASGRSIIVATHDEEEARHCHVNLRFSH